MDDLKSALEKTELAPDPVQKPVDPVEKNEIELLPSLGRALHVELGIGSSFLGSATTMSATRGSKLEITAMGIRASKDGRLMLIPWANVRAVELEGSVRAKSRRK